MSTTLSSTLAAFAASAGGATTSKPHIPPAYVIVCGHEGGDPVELPLDKEGAMAIKTLQIEFTEALGVKYRNPETGIYRIIAPDSGRLFPPAGGWGGHHYIACIPKSLEERPWDPRSTAAPQAAPSPYISQASTYTPPAKVMGYSPVGGMGRPMRGAAPGMMGSRGMRGAPRGQPMVRGSPMGRGAPIGRGAPRARARGAGPPGGAANNGAYVTRAPQKGLATKDFDLCEICGITSNSQTQADAHYSGKKHLEKAAGRGGAARGRGRGTYKNDAGANFQPPATSTAPASADYTKDDLGGTPKLGSNYTKGSNMF